MILDEGVFGIIIAITIIASIFSIAMILRPNVTEPFIALSLLNEYCKIGDYPKYAYIDQNLTLCISILNYLNKPVYWKIIYRIGSIDTLPTNTTPSPEPALKTWRGVLNHGENTTFNIVIPIKTPKHLANAKNITLIFELWLYDTNTNKWIYSGRWVHLHIELRR